LNISSANSNEQCLAFLPYGYNDFFVHLPRNKNFCVKTPDGNVSYNTNGDGARFIKGRISSQAIYAFGESQLLEIFPVNSEPHHLLSNIYGDRDILIHGAPNNGPNETLNFIKYIMFEKKNRPQNIVIGFNLGFDYFRIIPGWKTRKMVPYKSTQIPFMFNSPKLFELLHLSKLVFSNKIKVVNAEKDVKKARLYFKRRKADIIAYFNDWLVSLEKIKIKNNLEIDLVMYQPYWAYSLEDDYKKLSLDKSLEADTLEIFCKAIKINSNLFKNIFYFDFNRELKKENLFTYDYRHFKYREPLVIKNDSICQRD